MKSMPTDSGDLFQALKALLLWSQPLLDLQFQMFDGSLHSLQETEQLLQKKLVMGTQVSRERFDELSMFVGNTLMHQQG
jgi:hypothetical protein